MCDFHGTQRGRGGCFQAFLAPSFPLGALAEKDPSEYRFQYGMHNSALHEWHSADAMPRQSSGATSNKRK
jgi:hypothetical protein